MRLAKRIFVVASILLTLQSVIHAKEWRGIVPLHSTRADVERLFGEARTACKCVYDLEDVTIQLTYSDGGCEAGASDRWNVAPSTVIRFNVHPKIRQRLTDLVFGLRLDLKKFKKIEDPELPGIVHYSDTAEGVVISVEGETVIDYGFEPTAEDKSLRCPILRGAYANSEAPLEQVPAEPHTVRVSCGSGCSGGCRVAPQ